MIGKDLDKEERGGARKEGNRKSGGVGKTNRQREQEAGRETIKEVIDLKEARKEGRR